MSPFDTTQDDNPLQVLTLKDGSTTTVEKVRNYFSGIFAAEESGKEFPVNLDHVWKLAYARKEECKRALVNMNFLENVDFEVSRRNAENPKGGRPTEIVMLSVQATEHLIARKVKEIFEIYRQCRIEVTKRARAQKTSKPISSIGMMRLMLDELEKMESKIQDQGERLRHVEIEVDRETNYQSLLAWCKMNGYSFPPAIMSAWSRRLGIYCTENGIDWTKAADPIYGQKSIFPIWVIWETFETLGPKMER